MKIITSSGKMQKTAFKLLQKGKKTGFVPTMGALHNGHLSLIKKSRKQNDITIVSIFVNPKQFGPNEDYLRYPRPFKHDKKLCIKAGVNYLFKPQIKEMYSNDYLTYVNVEKISSVLCGKFRLGHFRGVTTIVAKLFNIVQPTNAYFGKKDFQQLQIIKKMVKDLNFDVKIIECPTIREKNGLAISSRNMFLTKDQYEQSVKVYKSLQLGYDLIKSRRAKSIQNISKNIIKSLNEMPESKLDYLEFLDTKTLKPVKAVKKPLIITIAIWLDKTRLIDNILVN